MSSKSGFFCELPTATIKKIRRLAHAAGSQGAAVQAAIERMPEPPPVTAKSNGELMLARALVKDSTRQFPGKFKRGRVIHLTPKKPGAPKFAPTKSQVKLWTPATMSIPDRPSQVAAAKRPFVPPTRVQLNVLGAHKVHVTPGSLSRAGAAKMIEELMVQKRAKREGRALRRAARR
jgi:hypothetical protein